MFFTAIYTGLRQGELLGLKWEDVRDGIIHVWQALKRGTDGKYYFGSVKTRASRRAVVLSEQTIAVLEQRRDRQEQQRLKFGPDYYDLGLVFTAANGHHLRPRNVLRVHYRVLDRARLEHVPFHALRHTHATLLLLNGIHPKVVQERLGHASIRETLDTYSHVIPSMQEDVASLLDDLFQNNSDQPPTEG